MKLSWRDAINTLMLIAVGAIVYARHYSYSWTGIGTWQSSVAWLAIIGLVMFAFSSFDFANRSILNIGEMVFGSAAIILAVIGVLTASGPVFYSLAAVLGVLWLVNVARHVRHSVIGSGPAGPRHVPVH